MNRFSGFAEQISTLLQNAGDIGDIGDTSKNMSPANGLGVTKMGKHVSPNQNDLVTAPAKFGDGKGELNQSLSCGVTNVTNVTNVFNEGSDEAYPAISGPVRARAREDLTGHCAGDGGEFCDQYARARDTSPQDVGIPLEWLNGLERLRSMSPLDSFTSEQWRQLVHDAEVFLEQWGATAAALGWTTLDLFAIHPTVPTIRHDAKGLIPALTGNAIANLSKDAATIRMHSGSILRFYRLVCDRHTCLWEALR